MSEKAVKIVECPRDAWQGLSRHIPSETKAEYLRALVGAGFKQIDAVSFVAPRAVPQMADSEDVLKRLDPPDDVEIIGIVVNEKGAERALATDAVRTLGFPYSISETFLKKNQNQTAEENSDALEAVWRKAEEQGLGMVAYVSMAFGNPYGDLWNVDELCRQCRTSPTWESRRFRWRTPWEWRRRRRLRRSWRR
jgi:hydroxymethylglutaryl-CoA lyase